MMIYTSCIMSWLRKLPKLSFKSMVKSTSICQTMQSHNSYTVLITHLDKVSGPVQLVSLSIYIFFCFLYNGHLHSSCFPSSSTTRINHCQRKICYVQHKTHRESSPTEKLFFHSCTLQPLQIFLFSTSYIKHFLFDMHLWTNIHMVISLNLIVCICMTKNEVSIFLRRPCKCLATNVHVHVRVWDWFHPNPSQWRPNSKLST